MIHWLAHLIGFNHCHLERDSRNVLWCVCSGCGRKQIVMSDRLARRAFALLELLACIAILALLIALLAPHLSQSRAAARDTACRANLRSAATMFSAYWHDRNEFPLEWSDLYDLNEGKPNKAMVCPADREGGCYILLTNEAGPFVRARPEAVAAMDPHNFAVAFDRGGWHPWVNAGYLDGSAR